MIPAKGINARRSASWIAGLLTGLLTTGILNPWMVGYECLEEYILESKVILIGKAVEKSTDPVRIDKTSYVGLGIDETKFYSLKIEVSRVLKGKIHGKYARLLYPVSKFRENRHPDGCLIGGVGPPSYSYTELKEWGKERIWFLTQSNVEAGFYKKVNIYSLAELSLIEATLPILELNKNEQVAELIKWLASDNRTFVWTALDMLARRKAKTAVEPLISMFGIKDVELLIKVYMTLFFINDDVGNLKVIEELQSALRGKTEAAVFVIISGFNDRRVIPVLIEALDNPDCQAKEIVISQLGNLGAKEAVVKLLPYLEDADPNVRDRTYRALGEIGDARALPQLERALIRAAWQWERKNIEKAIQEIKRRMANPY